MPVKAILGKKIGMTQVFDEAGRVVPVTVIAAGPCFVTQVKSVDKDGYSAAQLGFQEVKVQRLSRPEQGHLAAAGVRSPNPRPVGGKDRGHGTAHRRAHLRPDPAADREEDLHDPAFAHH